MTRLPRLLALAAVSLAALVGAGCGTSHGVTTIAQTEGIYVTINGLKYQVQISRQLNPHDREDQAYLVGLPEGEEPSPDETWFGVFLRVQNDGDEPYLAADDFEIVDTQERVYRPVTLDDTNVFAYRARVLEAGDLIPNPNDVAHYAPTQGTLLLFKMTVESLANRPLEFHITSPENADEVATIDLDV